MIARQLRLSIIVLLFSLGAALLLAGCADGSGAWNPSGSVSSAAQLSSTVEAGAFVPAALVTPAAASDTADGTDEPAADDEFLTKGGGEPAQFAGAVTGMPADGRNGVWQVSGRDTYVDSNTSVDESQGRAAVGAQVMVVGWERPDGGVDAGWINVLDASAPITATPAILASAPLTQSGALTQTGAVSPTLPAALATALAVPTSSAPVAATPLPVIATPAPGVIATAPVVAQAPVTAPGSFVSGQPAQLCGPVQQYPSAGLVGEWRIGDRIVRISPQTRVSAQQGRFEIGGGARVRGWLQVDGSINAVDVRVKKIGANPGCRLGLIVGRFNGEGDDGGQDNDNEGNDDDRNNDDGKNDDDDEKNDDDQKNDDDDQKVEFEGVVERLPAGGLVGTWVVSGRQIVVDEETKVKAKSERGMIGPGMRVKIEGRVESDGAVRAKEIEAKD